MDLEEYKAQLRQAQINVDEEVEEEEESDDGSSSDVQPDEDNKRRLAKLTEIMMQRFIDGLDNQHFDYSNIDDNPQYDDMKIMEQDAEDAYFAEDE